MMAEQRANQISLPFMQPVEYQTADALYAGLTRAMNVATGELQDELLRRKAVTLTSIQEYYPDISETDLVSGALQLGGLQRTGRLPQYQHLFPDKFSSSWFDQEIIQCSVGPASLLIMENLPENQKKDESNKHILLPWVRLAYPLTVKQISRQSMARSITLPLSALCHHDIFVSFGFNKQRKRVEMTIGSFGNERVWDERSGRVLDGFKHSMAERRKGIRGAW